MLGTCDRHVQLLDIIEQSPDEYSLENVDRKETAGRNWLPLFASSPWSSLLSYLLNKFLRMVLYFLRKIGFVKKLKIL